MEIKEVNKKRYMKILSESLMFLFLAAAFVLPANAALTGGQVGPIHQVTSFPQWYSDTQLRLQPCLALTGQEGVADPNCALAAAGAFDPALGIDFPGNFPDEFFYWDADSVMKNGDPDAEVNPSGISATLVLALEGNFAVQGDQTVFGRVRIKMNVPARGNYTVTHPFGERTFFVNATEAGPEIFDTSDIGCIGAPINGVPLCSLSIVGQPGIPNLFALALFSDIGPRFLTWDTFGQAPPIGPPVGYIGDPAIEHPVTGSLAGTNFFRVTADNPNADLDANVVDVQTTIQENNFTVLGKIFAISRFNISGFKINDTDGNGVSNPGEPGIANWTIMLNTTAGAPVATALTDASGFYNFINIADGSYTLTEETRAGFIPTNATTKAIILNANLINQNFTNMNVTGAAITNVSFGSGAGVGNRGGQIIVLVNLSSPLAATRTFVVVVSGVAADGSPLVGATTVELTAAGTPGSTAINKPVFVAIPPSATPGTYELRASLLPIETFQTLPPSMIFPTPVIATVV